MADDRVPDRKRSGTYLFVRPKTARRLRNAPTVDSTPPTFAPGGPGLPLPGGRGAEGGGGPAENPREAADAEDSRGRTARLRYRRPRLEPAALDGRLVFFLSPDAAVTEPYRQVAATLAGARPALRRIWVAGAAPGAGATLTVANLGSALTEFGRVTLIDADPARAGGSLTALFGLAGSPAGGALDSMDLWLISDRLALQPDAALVPATDEAARQFQAVAAAADFVLVDGPPLEAPGAVAAMRDLVDAVVLVIRPNDLGRGHYERALTALDGVPVAGVVVNGAAESESRPQPVA